MKRLFLLSAVALALTACSEAPQTSTASQPATTAESAQLSESERLNAWFEEKYEQQLQFSPLMMTRLGRKERYDQIDDMSEQGQEKRLQWMAATVDELQENFDYSKLDEDTKISYDIWMFQFEQAKKQAPCIIFIDEIDAVGRHRGAGLGGGHDEREQTLNQLLVEMDGFEANDGVIVMAATNRPDVLDPALLRPGRFDRQVVVSLPDIRGREQILKVHMRKVPIDDDVKANVIARGSPGFSGADLANLVNEAALFAARAGRRLVTMEEFEKAKDKIMMGAERKSMVMSEKEKLNTAYHEAGHAIVGRLMPDHDPVYKVSIIPRGRALGVTMFLPEEDRYSISRQHIISNICSLYGGRIAEEMTLGKDGVTTGASNDIQRATEMARNMVTKWGLSDKLGPVLYSEDEGEIFLGRSAAMHQKTVSSDTAIAIDKEVRRIIDACYKKAEDLLESNKEKLELMKDALMEYETIDALQIDDIMAGKAPRPPADWSDSNNKTESDDKDSDTSKVNKGETDKSSKIGGPASEH